jgi:hypothetical protein
MGFSRAIRFIGSRNRVHEVLNRRGPLTLKMIWRLHTELGIPAESLIKLKRDGVARRTGPDRAIFMRGPFCSLLVA